MCKDGMCATVPEGVVQRWMHHPDSVMPALLIHLLENTLEDLHERDSADLLPVRVSPCAAPFLDFWAPALAKR